MIIGKCCIVSEENGHGWHLLALLSVVAVEMDLDESGKYESYSLQLYNISAAISCTHPARDVQHCGLALSTSALSLCVCPVSGRVMVLLSNGILIIVQAVDGVFELVLELVCLWFLLHFACLFFFAC